MSKDKKSKKTNKTKKPSNKSNFPEMTLKELAAVLALTIKHDYENKIITFLAMLSAYTHKNQINVSFNAPSSSGKTYMTTEVAKLFPEEDKIELSGASPTSFYHGEGVFDEARKAKIVQLSRKILIFYEQPDPKLQEKLRSVMSHDKWEIKYRITNKGKKGENRAELIIIEGFPATVFCSAGLRLDEQEATRAILLSPEVTEDKLKEGVHLQAIRGANEAGFEYSLESHPHRAALKRRILAIRAERVDDILIADVKAIEERFRSKLNRVKPRHMRDMSHLMKLIKAIALLNVWHRRQSHGMIVVAQSDVDQAFELWEKFIESQDLNIPPAALSFYKQYILPAFMEKKESDRYTENMESGAVGLSRDELSSYYFRNEGSTLNFEYLRKQYLPLLENCSMVTQRQPTDGSDRRSRHIFPIWLPEQNNIGQGQGTPIEGDKINDPFDH